MGQREYTTPFVSEQRIIHGDSLERLKELPDNSIDSIVTDPPAGISFIGAKWDSDKGGMAKMAQVAHKHFSRMF
jgi:hypothetical protein